MHGIAVDRDRRIYVGDRSNNRIQIFTEDGSLNRFVNVYVNGRDVRYEQELGTPVGESDEVILLPAMAGGR